MVLRYFPYSLAIWNMFNTLTLSLSVSFSLWLYCECLLPPPPFSTHIPPPFPLSQIKKKRAVSFACKVQDFSWGRGQCSNWMWHVKYSDGLCWSSSVNKKVPDIYKRKEYVFGLSTTWTEVLCKQTPRLTQRGSTHDLPIMTVHFVSLRCLCLPLPFSDMVTHFSLEVERLCHFVALLVIILFFLK